MLGTTAIVVGIPTVVVVIIVVVVVAVVAGIGTGERMWTS